jgi:AcrR family transcriptional regulator
MSTVTHRSADDSPARRRLLDTATRLFYAEGVHSVGIDRIIAEACVAKATFYKHFPSKDDLVCVYIEEQHGLGEAAIAALPDSPPREKLVAIFDRVGQAARQPGYRGCPFLNAAAEYPDPRHPVRQAIDAHRRWFCGLLHGLLVADNHPDPARTADVLVVLWDGLLISGHIDGSAGLPVLTRRALDSALDAASSPA